MVINLIHVLSFQKNKTELFYYHKPISSNFFRSTITSSSKINSESKKKYHVKHLLPKIKQHKDSKGLKTFSLKEFSLKFLSKFSLSLIKIKNFLRCVCLGPYKLHYLMSLSYNGSSHQSLLQSRQSSKSSAKQNLVKL